MYWSALARDCIICVHSWTEHGAARESDHMKSLFGKITAASFTFFYFVKLYRRESPAELVLFGAGDEGENAL